MIPTLLFRALKAMYVKYVKVFKWKIHEYMSILCVPIILFVCFCCRRWYQQPVKRRYVVASLAFLGFCCVYMLRVNLSVAIVAMTANRTHTHDNGTIAVVRIIEPRN